MNVVVLGASNKPDRYSNIALKKLIGHGHTVIPVHPAIPSIEGISCVQRLEDIKIPVDTLTIYVSPEISSSLADTIISLKPNRIIFNPGTENEPLEKNLASHEISCIHACTIVMLNTNQF